MPDKSGARIYHVRRDNLLDGSTLAVDPPWPSLDVVLKRDYERIIACLGQAVEALDLATHALAAGDKLPQRAVLTAKLATATRELREAVGEAVRGGA